MFSLEFARWYPEPNQGRKSELKSTYHKIWATKHTTKCGPKFLFLANISVYEILTRFYKNRQRKNRSTESLIGPLAKISGVPRKTRDIERTIFNSGQNIIRIKIWKIHRRFKVFNRTKSPVGFIKSRIGCFYVSIHRIDRNSTSFSEIFRYPIGGLIATIKTFYSTSVYFRCYTFW